MTTKYLSFGACSATQYVDICGLNTGFYLTLQRGASLVVGLQVCTANDGYTRDPLTVTLEGSNQSGIELTFGTSWTLIYDESCDLYTNVERYTCGDIQYFDNSLQYTNYRFLVTSKRMNSNAVQYSEVKLFGY